jgi:outer membrane protein, multidrug efflux system
MKKLITLLTSAMLISCATAPSRQEVKMDVDLPTTWAAYVETTADSSLIELDWWTSFKSPQLDHIINEAFQQNLNLSIAAANIEAAMAQTQIAGASLYPGLSAGFDGSRRKQNYIGLPFPGFGDNVLSSTSTNLGVSLNLSWELDLWGRMRAERSRAGASFQAAQADYVGAHLSLAGQMTKAWIAAMTAKRQVELAEATHKSWEMSSEQMNQRYLGGISGSLEYRLSLSNLSLSESNYHSRVMQYEGALRQLELLLKQYPSATFNLTVDFPVLEDAVPVGLPADLISRRPDLVSAERRLAASYMGVKAAKRALYPQISLTSSSGTSSNQLADLIDGDFGVWSLAGNLMQPIFQGRMLRANVDVSEAQAKMALADYENAVLTALAEVESALSNERHLIANESALEAAAEQSKAARQLAESQYSRGVTGFLTMLESTRSAFDTESRYLDARRARLDARIDLYLALGGGFEIDNKLAILDD